MYGDGLWLVLLAVLWLWAGAVMAVWGLGRLARHDGGER